MTCRFIKEHVLTLTGNDVNLVLGNHVVEYIGIDASCIHNGLCLDAFSLAGCSVGHFNLEALSIFDDLFNLALGELDI